MKASYAWIRELVPGYSADPPTMAEQLTFSGSEVESVEGTGEAAILDVGVTSNRVDCLCHVGLAREVAAVAGLAVLPPDDDVATSGTPTEGLIGVLVEDAPACPRFTARVIEGIRVGPSPRWLKDRLESIGLRSVNNVVDATNYVLLECNQPLHAYDLDRLTEGRLVVRRARAGEKLTVIDGSVCELAPEDLVIADAREPVGLAGVMGGRDTEVGEGTTRILLEAAYFDPATIRAAARRHQITSDAGYRFERGLDRASVLTASGRAARLILEVAGGSLRPGPLDVGGPGPDREPLRLRPSDVERVCGVPIDRDRIVTILRALACTVDPDAEALTVVPPSFRADLARPIDLVEEVIRLHGLHHLPVEARMPIAPVRPHPGREMRERVRDDLVGLGYVESVTPNFVREGLVAEVTFLIEGEGLVVRNPVRKGEGAMRRSLLPSLLQVRKLNQDRGNEDVRLFEVGNVHAAPAGGAGDVVYVPTVGWLTDGDLRDARGVAEFLGSRGGLDVEVVPRDDPWFEPGTGATLRVEGRTLGVLGHPGRRLMKELGLKVLPAYGELDLLALRTLSRGPRTFTGLARFPGVVRDLALVVDEARPYGDIERTVREAAPRHLEGLELFDVFRGAQIGKGRKSLAIRLAFRSPEGTLTSDEVEAEMQRLMGLLRTEIGAEVRGA